ncbi:unnamed protein product [Mucor circinelloides]
MSQEIENYIAKQKQVFVKISTAALDDIDNELNKSKNKKNKRKKSTVKNKAEKKRKTITTNNPGVQFLKQFKSPDNKGKKAKYFELISRNYIIDMTDSSHGSHLSLFTENLKLYLDNACSDITTLYPVSSISNVNVINEFEKKSNSFSVSYMKKTKKALNSFPATNNEQRRRINIYSYILEMHLYKLYLFNHQNMKLYSEQDFIVKFWSYIFEEAFSNSGLCLLWGDTKPRKAQKKENINMKIDLRVLYCSNTEKPDISVGEFAKKAVPSKLYLDKLKQVIISKYHLNALLSLGLSPSTTLVPFVQIMGLECHLYALRQVQDFYVVQTIDCVTFPVTHSAIKDNGIQRLLSCLEMAKVKRFAFGLHLNVYSVKFIFIEFEFVIESCNQGS